MNAQASSSFLLIVYGNMVWGGEEDGDFYLPGYDETLISIVRGFLRADHGLDSCRFEVATAAARTTLHVIEVPEHIADQLPAPYDGNPDDVHTWVHIRKAIKHLDSPLRDLVTAYGVATQKLRVSVVGGRSRGEDTDSNPPT